MEPITARAGDGLPKAPVPGTAELVFPMEAWVADERIPVTARAMYHSSAPYEVTLEFLVHGESIGQWVFARDLLLEDSAETVGAGDVKVWTQGAREGRPERVHLYLDNGIDRCALVADHHHIVLWRKVVTSMVPPGSESRHMDIDGLLCRLLTD
ncbi:SsgA family sporulation/cell division regulator [Streptomyces sp. NPDC090025]|uniref:SsgA family sporulation/cell division regulator n=1 Tax=Streptomyces sp. NPDC090025 TaxID=3365922 RepID=UPI00383948EA